MRETEQLNPQAFIDQKVLEIRKSLVGGKALVAVSGGVDSSTCAALTHLAVGEQLAMVFIDTGLMRENEGERVKRAFYNLGMNLEIVEAQGLFFAGLAGKLDPEEKRIAFRTAFYQVLAREIKDRGINSLVQGTIRADILETVSGVKTQHNVLAQIGIDPKQWGFEVIEPLKDLFKDQVREIARALGLPQEIYGRMPFPGPGLAIRVVGEVTREKVGLVRKATQIVEEETAQFSPFQAFAVLLADKATGVKEGKRTFGNIIVVRSVESEDALTATVSQVPWKNLVRIQERIAEEIPEISRVLFDLTPKPPATIEYI